MIKLRDIFSKKDVLDPGTLVYRRQSNHWRLIVPIAVLIVIGAAVWFFVFNVNWFSTQDPVEMDLVIKRKPVVVEFEQQPIEQQKPAVTVEEEAVDKNDVRNQVEPLDKVLKQYQDQ